MRHFRIFFLGVVVCVAGCGSVGDTVLQDFGLQDRPEGYVSGADRVMENMQVVGATEMRRLNGLERRGEVKFGKSELDGSDVYYKVVKNYQAYVPIEAQPSSRNSQSNSGGFVGYIQYNYEMLEGPRKSNRVEAEASSATIPSGVRGADTFRYRFSSSSVWNGSKGEFVK